MTAVSPYVTSLARPDRKRGPDGRELDEAVLEQRRDADHARARLGIAGAGPRHALLPRRRPASASHRPRSAASWRADVDGYIDVRATWAYDAAGRLVRHEQDGPGTNGPAVPRRRAGQRRHVRRRVRRDRRRCPSSCTACESWTRAALTARARRRELVESRGVIETDYLVIGSGLAGLYFALRAVRARAGGGRDQARARRRQHRLRPGRRGRHAGSRRHRGDRHPRRRHAARGRRAVPPRHRRDLRARGARAHPVVRQRARASRSTATPTGTWRSGARAATPPAASSTPRTRPAGRSRRRCWPGVARRADRITMLPDHMAIDLLTTAKYGGPNAVFGAYLLDQATRRGGSRRRARGGAGHRRLRARSTSTRRTPTSRPATASRWRTGWARASRTWSSSSSTRPASTTPPRSRS